MSEHPFYRYLGNEFIPGSIVEGTGNRKHNPRTGWESVEVRYPSNGEFKTLWFSPHLLVRCEPPENWLANQQTMPAVFDVLDLSSMADERERQAAAEATSAGEEKRGLFLEWDKSVDEAITCLVLIANGDHWQRWEQDRTDTRGIVSERAAKAIKAVQRDLATTRQQLEDSEGAVSKALHYLGVSPGDWSEGLEGIESAVKGNLAIETQKLTWEDWTDNPESIKGTITEMLLRQQAELATLRKRSENMGELLGRIAEISGAAFDRDDNSIVQGVERLKQRLATAERALESARESLDLEGVGSEEIEQALAAIRGGDSTS